MCQPYDFLSHVHVRRGLLFVRRLEAALLKISYGRDLTLYCYIRGLMMNPLGSARPTREKKILVVKPFPKQQKLW